MLLGFMMSTEICGNGFRIMQVRIIVLIQTASSIQRAPHNERKRLFVEVIIQSQRKKCAHLTMIQKQKPLNTLVSASGSERTHDRQHYKNNRIRFNNPILGKIQLFYFVKQYV